MNWVTRLTDTIWGMRMEGKIRVMVEGGNDGDGASEGFLLYLFIVLLTVLSHFRVCYQTEYLLSGICTAS
jgi:hypothetical protein